MTVTVLYTHFWIVSYLSFAENEAKTVPRSSPRTEADRQSRIWASLSSCVCALVWFFSAHLPPESRFSPSEDSLTPAPPAGPGSGSGCSLQATARVGPGLRHQPASSLPARTPGPGKGPELPSSTRQGLGGSDPLSPWKAGSQQLPAARCAPIKRARTFEKGECPGHQLRSSSPISPATCLWGELRGAGGHQDPFPVLSVGRARGPF